MKTLLLSLVLLSSSFTFAGGTSGVGPCGPDCAAQSLFESNPEVTAAISEMKQLGYTVQAPDHDINQFTGYMNCGKPTPLATWTACERLYVFTRAYSLPQDSDEIRTVTALVIMTIQGSQVQLVKSK